MSERKNVVDFSAMKVLTAAEMREIDRTTIEDIGIPGPILMENAGIRIVGVMRRSLPALAGERIVIVAGKGNNGGDGFVVARHLLALGAKPRIILLAAKAEVRGDAALNLGMAAKLGLEVIEAPTIEAWRKARPALLKATVIVDAIFGTGLQKAAEGVQAAAIADVNRADGFTIAVDVPSGLSSDTPLLIGPAVRADLTVTLAAPKICHVLPPAEAYVGALAIEDIGIPARLLEDPGLKLSVLEREDVAPFLRKRGRDTHKGSFGHLFILSGSRGKSGAAVLAGRAALRSGAGLVTVGTPAACLPAIARPSPELMVEPLPDTPEGTLSERALGRILELISGKDAVLIGPGLSTHPETSRLILKLLPKIKVPVVLDADGLNIVAAGPEILRRMRAPAVLTPHPGEFARLAGLPVKEVLDRRLELAREFAAKYGTILVFKGYRTLIATPDGTARINPTGNPGMATGGSGDVLSGMIASLIVQEKDIAGAAAAAVYVHGLSGDIGAARLGERGLIAGDLIRHLPAALRPFENR
jgi:ADP-dependent NAD(P)H-hydrate dehydratase / NAD(P)H-hydrate epimerase